MDKAKILRDRMVDLRKAYQTCVRCGLCRSRTSVALPRGKMRPHIMVIGEHPTMAEDVKGSAWEGPAGRLLVDVHDSTKYYDGAGNICLPDLWVSHTLLCVPLFFDRNDRPELRAPTDEEVSACLPRLLEEIALLDPEVIVLMGNLPARVLTKQRKQMRNIAGTLDTIHFTHEGYPVQFPAYITYAPDYLLRVDAARDPNGPTRFTMDLFRSATRLALYVRSCREGQDPTPTVFASLEASRLGSL